MGDEHLAVRCVPGRNLVSPPELTRNAPVLNIFKPLVVGGCPVLRIELNIAFRHDIERYFSDAFTRMKGVGRGGLTHCHKPLVRQHRLEHCACAIASGLHHFVCVNFNEIAFLFKFSDDGFACIEPIHASELGGALIVNTCIERENDDQRQVVALCASVIVEVMRSGDLDAAGTKGAIDKVVGNNWDLAIAQGEVDHFSYQVLIAFIFRMYAKRTVGKHGFGACRGDGHPSDRL